MTSEQKQLLIKTVSDREVLRPLSRLRRLKRYPWRTAPFYLLAILGHIKPFPLTFSTLWGTKMTCYLPEGNTFYYYGYCEANLTNFLVRFIKDEATCLDVGAHVGFYSMLLSELTGNNGSIHSFEPTPWTFTILKKNTENLPNVKLNNVAVSNIEQTLNFNDYGPGYGAFNTAHKSGSPDVHKAAKAVAVQSVCLDDYCHTNNLNPDFIKIDSEGFEFEVLSGASMVLDTVRPIISIEVAGGQTWAENTKKAFAYLAEKNYLPYQIDVKGTPTPHLRHDTYTYDNLIFIPTEKVSVTINSLLPYDHS